MAQRGSSVYPLANQQRQRTLGFLVLTLLLERSQRRQSGELDNCPQCLKERPPRTSARAPGVSCCHLGIFCRVQRLSLPGPPAHTTSLPAIAFPRRQDCLQHPTRRAEQPAPPLPRHCGGFRPGSGCVESRVALQNADGSASSPAFSTCHCHPCIP